MNQTKTRGIGKPKLTYLNSVHEKEFLQTPTPTTL